MIKKKKLIRQKPKKEGCKTEFDIIGVGDSFGNAVNYKT